MTNLSIASGIAFSIAALEARMLKSEYIDTEHLFLGLCKIEDILVVGPDIIEGISKDDWKMAKEEIHDFMELLTNIELDAKMARRRMRKILYESQNEKRQFSGHRSPHCREVFNKAENYCKYYGEKLLCLNHLLIAALEYRSPELNLLYSYLSFDKDNLLKDPGVAAAIENKEGHENVVMTAYGTSDNKAKKENEEQIKNSNEKNIEAISSVGLPSGLKDEPKELVSKIAKHDVFISYSSEDKPIADATCANLESKGIRCWIAPRDVLPGKNYLEEIIDAIDNTRIMVLIFSPYSNDSPYIIRELTEAVENDVVIIPFRIENVLPSKSMKFLINVPHWLDAMTPPLKQHLVKLAETIRLYLNNEYENVDDKI